MFVPRLIINEVADALWKKCRQQHLKPSEALERGTRLLPAISRNSATCPMLMLFSIWRLRSIIRFMTVSICRRPQIIDYLFVTAVAMIKSQGVINSRHPPYTIFRNGRHSTAYDLAPVRSQRGPGSAGDVARAFAAEKIAPPCDPLGRGEATVDARGRNLRDWPRLLSATTSAAPAALTRFDAALIFEALAQGCPTVSARSSRSTTCGLDNQDRLRQRHPRHKMAAKLCTMESSRSYCLTEPGSDRTPPTLRTRAVRDGESATSATARSDSFWVPARATSMWRWCGLARNGARGVLDHCR